MSTENTEMCVYFYALNTWLGFLLHELLQLTYIAAFRSSALLVLVSSSHLPPDLNPIDSLWGSGQASLLFNQVQLHHGH